MNHHWHPALAKHLINGICVSKIHQLKSKVFWKCCWKRIKCLFKSSWHVVSSKDSVPILWQLQCSMRTNMSCGAHLKNNFLVQFGHSSAGRKTPVLGEKNLSEWLFSLFVSGQKCGFQVTLILNFLTSCSSFDASSCARAGSKGDGVFLICAAFNKSNNWCIVRRATTQAQTIINLTVQQPLDEEARPPCCSLHVDNQSVFSQARCKEGLKPWEAFGKVLKCSAKEQWLECENALRWVWTDVCLTPRAECLTKCAGQLESRYLELVSRSIEKQATSFTAFTKQLT